MFAAIADLIGKRGHRGTSVDLQRNRIMARAKADHDVAERRARSGSAPTTSPPPQPTQDKQDHPTSTLSSTSANHDPHLTSKIPIPVSQHSYLNGVDDDRLRLESELKRAVKLNANLKEQARYAEAGLKSSIQQRDALQAMVEEYEWREQTKHGELIQAKTEIQHLKECLDDCKEKIFKMQPLEHLTDCEIAGQYRSLCESISDWTDSQFGDNDNALSGLDICLKNDSPASSLQEYLIQGHLMNVVKQTPNATCAVIIHLIQFELHQAVLRQDLCFPSLDLKFEKFVSLVANAMRTNEPCRGMGLLCLPVWLLTKTIR